MENADQKGVDVRYGAEVKQVDRHDDRRRVTWVDDHGDRYRIDAQFVVDASGYQSSFYDRVGERIFSDYFQNIALFGYFDGGDRLPEPDTGNMLSVAFDEGWVWYLPLRDGMTSVGAVFDKRLASDLENHDDRREALQHFIQKTPKVAELLGDAPPIEEGPYGEFRMRKDYSYCNTSFWDDGLLLVGDSACFIDPVFATGVHFATYGGLLAARSLNSILHKDLAPEECFREFEHRYKEEFAAFYDFLLSFYNMEASSADSYFWKAKQVLGSEEPEREAFVRLIGGAGTTLEEFTRTRSGFGEVLKAAHSSNADSQRDQLDHISRTVENADKLIEQVMESRQKRGAYRRDAFQGVAGSNLDVLPPADIGFEYGFTASSDGLFWEKS
ncbi:MAG: tryptophan 7-halogenase [Bradymonadaceae bacterium]